MAVKLEEIVPWGRLRREYELMFRLTEEDFDRGILDCGGGPSSFNAELHALEHRVVSFDPIYCFSAERIRSRFEAAGETVLRQVGATPDDWVWTVHRDLEDLHANRSGALELFLADYETGLSEGRYVLGELPVLPFRDQEFGLALCSHLLFLYSELLSEEFHVNSVLELARVANEIRIFPLLTLKHERSPYVAPVRTALEDRGWTSEIVRVPYEMQRGGNEMLVLRKEKAS